MSASEFGETYPMAITLNEMTSSVLDMTARLNEVERQFGRASEAYQHHLNEFAAAWDNLNALRYEHGLLLPKKA
jgi:hypothetical protein